MKVTGTRATDSETVSQIDLFDGMDLSESEKTRIAEKVGEYLVLETLSSLENAKSPVIGESFPKLTKEYKKFKLEAGGSGIPDMELTRDMKDEFTFQTTSEGLELGVFGSSAPKADGHNKFSGKESANPQRRWLPDEGQKYRTPIDREVDRIVAEGVAEGLSISKADLSDVETTSDLYDLLEEKMPGFSRSEISDAILVNDEIRSLLTDMDLLDLL